MPCDVLCVILRTLSQVMHWSEFLGDFRCGLTHCSNVRMLYTPGASHYIQATALQGKDRGNTKDGKNP